MNPFINQVFGSPNLHFKPCIPAKMETVVAKALSKLFFKYGKQCLWNEFVCMTKFLIVYRGLVHIFAGRK
jgi:hypothetical protein